MGMGPIGNRIVATILIVVFWFAFIVLYLAFFADGLNLWQKASVFLASGAIATGLIAVFWVKWAMK
jgi:Trk-type K+ transport system membrane component